MAKRKKIQNGEGYKVSEKCRSEDRGRPQARRKEGGPRDWLGLIAGARSDAVAALAQDAGQRRFAHFDRLSAKVGTVQLQKIEGVEEGARSGGGGATGRRPRRSHRNTQPRRRSDRISA